MDLLTAIGICAAITAAPDSVSCALGNTGPIEPIVAVADIESRSAQSRTGHAGSAALVAQWQPYIAEASRRFGVPAAWIRAVMLAESGGRTTRNGRPITSHAGALGLMQIMPRTYAEIRDRYGLGLDPHAPRNNILAGAAYLREMYDRFGTPGCFVAYNVGPGRYGEHLRDRRPLPEEALRYLSEIIMHLRQEVSPAPDQP